ncbi:MAG TPA: winged helix-turn-helix domain-containing protein [Candidatus Acidoferrales bacterium]|jgi:DNA-binding winged helix-turn-helix (wHTH) protein/tetratricopeptide (TPR) repeat protein|nr:winged helix-turn-helix domain-containing protein [Candidatus Acidoferrales bacterium]
MRVAKLTSEIELDLGRYELRRDGRRVKLEKKPMELLIFLVARRDQLVSRQEIVSKLWRSDLFIDTQTSINNIVRKLRTALGDNSAKPRFLETVVGKGYRFIGPVRVIDPRYGSSVYGQAPTATSAHSALQPIAFEQRPALAVLPLVLVGDLPDDHGLSLGFADALISRLGNLEGINVLPTSAVLNLPLEITPWEIGTRLQARFVVHGAMRALKGQWQLSVELLDTHLQRVCLARKSDVVMERLFDFEDDTARQIARALNRPLRPKAVGPPSRYSNDPMAYAEFMRGYRLSSSGDPAVLDEAAQRLINAISRDPDFSLAHATLSVVCATHHFEVDPTNTWLEKAEFHCAKALELNPDLPEAHISKAYLLWGPSKNFQHLEAITELRRALALQSNLPHAYNRLGTILAHIGLLDHAREMYDRGRQFHPQKVVSHSIVQVYLWGNEWELAREEIRAWRAENPGNKYAVYFAPLPAMMMGNWKEAEAQLNEAVQLLPDDPLIISLQGLFAALHGKKEQALRFLAQACASPKSFGHAHHTYYQVACILSILERHKPAFEWLERSVSTGFACWPFFLHDPCLQNLRSLPEFEVLVNSLQARYPDHLGLL